MLGTKTKTRTKAIVATTAVVVGLGLLAAAGLVKKPALKKITTKQASTKQASTVSAKPDLVVTSITPNDITGIVMVFIANTGTANAGAFDITLIALDSANNVIDSSTRRYTEGLTAGANGGLDFFFYPSGSSGSGLAPIIPLNTASFRAVIDVNNEITESNEGNNNYTQALIVTAGQPDLTVSITAQCNSTSRGPIKWTATETNLGSVTAGSHLFVVAAIDSNYPVQGGTIQKSIAEHQESIVSVLPGETKTYVDYVSASTIASGADKILAGVAVYSTTEPSGLGEFPDVNNNNNGMIIDIPSCP